MNPYDKTLDAHMTISGNTSDELLQRIHDLCDISTDYSLEGRSVLGKVTRVIDGDSMKVSIPVDGHVWTFPIRVSGIDCPEIRTKNLREKELGFEAKSRVEELVLGKIVSLQLGFMNLHKRYGDTNIGFRFNFHLKTLQGHRFINSLCIHSLRRLLSLK